MPVIDLRRANGVPAGLRTEPKFQEYFAKIWGDPEKPGGLR
ncbi:hypothetical protein [Bradyrhizobium sp. CCBAU 53421]|nr:hypothetical protein [Bradyrhizobium sp. CCBAU 53421]